MAAEGRRSWVRGGEGNPGARAAFAAPNWLDLTWEYFLMIARTHRRAATSAVLLGMALAGVFALPATAETPDEQKARVQRIEDAVLAPCCYTEPVSRHQSEVAIVPMSRYCQTLMTKSDRGAIRYSPPWGEPPQPSRSLSPGEPRSRRLWPQREFPAAVLTFGAIWGTSQTESGNAGIDGLCECLEFHHTHILARERRQAFALTGLLNTALVHEETEALSIFRPLHTLLIDNTVEPQTQRLLQRR